MSLTISQSTWTGLGSGYTDEFTPRNSLSQSRPSPTKSRIPHSPPPVTSLRASATPDGKMTTPHHTHRGLPPPSAMNLPDPNRSGPPPSLNQQLGSMPEPPRQWQGQEDAMRNWLAAKAEEDRRKQEEEKTRQESLKLEQRKIEQAMLRESLQGGVPPAMVPLIYAGIGSGHLVNVSMEWLQQYAGQLQMSQQQVQQSSPDMRRDGRPIGPPAPYPATQPPQHPSQQPAEPQPPMQTTFSAYLPSPNNRQQNTSAPRSAAQAQLPRLTTNEIYVPQPPPPQSSSGSAHPLQQSQKPQEAPANSPSIYFHHWHPPGESKSNHQPQTPASKAEPSSAHPGSSSSNLKDGDHKDSPRKRKAPGEHQANPHPSTGPHYSSPSLGAAPKAAHSRTRSNTSVGREADVRPESSSSRLDKPPPMFQDPEPGSKAGNGHAPHVMMDGHAQRSASRTRPDQPLRAVSNSADAPASYQGPHHPAQPRPGSS